MRSLHRGLLLPEPIRKLEAWTEEHGFLDNDGKPTAPANLIVQFEKLAMSLRARIGLDPKSRAELQSARAQAALTTFDLEALKERGREAMLERSA